MKSLILNVEDITNTSLYEYQKRYLESHWSGFSHGFIVTRTKYLHDNLPSKRCMGCSRMLSINGYAMIINKIDCYGRKYKHYYCNDRCYVADLI